ncbi:MAG: class I SAM-dependent methyltransferase [Terricaulis sp.]
MSLDSVFRKIGIDRDYVPANFADLQPDMQGWGSTHPIFQTMMTQVRPSVVIEVGTWKGASVLGMARIAEALGLPTEFICVDTWLGSNDALWLNDTYRASLLLKDGYPSMFRQFIRNVISEDAVKRIYPLPITSSGGYHLLKALGVTAQLIYIDAGHEEIEVYPDLVMYYELLEPGGIMLGDDFSKSWPGVIAAVKRFCKEQELELHEERPSKFWFRKPA